jgi:phosphate-selective porin OprO/OprP
MRGFLYKDLAFRVELRAEQGQLELQENYLSVDDIPYAGTIKTGHFKERFGLEHSTTLRHAHFLENSLMDGITPARGLGVSIANTAFGERIAWSLGLYFGTQTLDKIGERKSLSLTGRITGLPVYDEEAVRLLHLGLSLSHRELNASLGYKVRPEVEEAERYLDTGEFSADELHMVGLEAAYQDKSWLAQAELTWSATKGAVRAEEVTLNEIADEIANRAPRLADWLAGRAGWERPADSILWNIPFDLAARGDLGFFGAYAQVGYVLTGEHREYDRRGGVFGPVIPDRPVSLREGGAWGAWEVAARISHLDLNDEYVKGGRETNVTLGLNWYLSRDWRISMNYVHGDVHRDVYDGNFDALVMRVQLDVLPRVVHR